MSPAASTTDKPGANASTSTSGGAELKVSTSPRPGSRLAVEISVPADRTSSCHEQAVEKLSRTLKLPGLLIILNLVYLLICGKRQLLLLQL